MIPIFHWNPMFLVKLLWILERSAAQEPCSCRCHAVLLAGAAVLELLRDPSVGSADCEFSPSPALPEVLPAAEDIGRLGSQWQNPVRNWCLGDIPGEFPVQGSWQTWALVGVWAGGFLLPARFPDWSLLLGFEGIDGFRDVSSTPSQTLTLLLSSGNPCKSHFFCLNAQFYSPWSRKLLEVGVAKHLCPGFLILAL